MVKDIFIRSNTKLLLKFGSLVCLATLFACSQNQMNNSENTVSNLQTTKTNIEKDMKIKQRLSLITIGVQDLQAIRRFYEEKLEWKPVAVNKDIVFYQLNGMLLSFFPQKDLEKDARSSGGEIKSKGFALAYLVHTEQEVDELFAALEKKGVKIVKRPEKTFFGSYGGHFADVEGNLWDLAYNLYIEMDAEGNVIGHKDIKDLEQ